MPGRIGGVTTGRTAQQALDAQFLHACKVGSECRQAGRRGPAAGAGQDRGAVWMHVGRAHSRGRRHAATHTRTSCNHERRGAAPASLAPPAIDSPGCCRPITQILRFPSASSPTCGVAVGACRWGCASDLMEAACWALGLPEGPLRGRLPPPQPLLIACSLLVPTTRLLTRSKSISRPSTLSPCKKNRAEKWRFFKVGETDERPWAGQERSGAGTRRSQGTGSKPLQGRSAGVAVRGRHCAIFANPALSEAR